MVLKTDAKNVLDTLTSKYIEHLRMHLLTGFHSFQTFALDDNSDEFKLFQYRHISAVTRYDLNP